MTNTQFYFKGPNAHDLFDKSGKFEVFFENQRKPKMVSVRSFKSFLADVESKGYKLVVEGDQSLQNHTKFDNWSQLRNSSSDGYFGLNGSKILIVK